MRVATCFAYRMEASMSDVEIGSPYYPGCSALRRAGMDL